MAGYKEFIDDKKQCTWDGFIKSMCLLLPGCVIPPLKALFLIQRILVFSAVISLSNST